MARVQANEVAAFEQLYDRYAARAIQVASAICRDMRWAEDCVQESFLAIWRRRASYRPEIGSFAAWTMGIVRNRAIDLIRRESARQRLRTAVVHEETSKPMPALPEDTVISRSNGEALRGALHRLPQAQAEVIVLAFFGGLSHSEIASQLDLPPGTVKGRMRLGLKKLRSQINESSSSARPLAAVEGRNLSATPQRGGRPRRRDHPRARIR